MKNNQMKFITQIGAEKYYIYTPSILKLFYENYEPMTLKKFIRFSIEYLRGYRIYYMYEGEEVIGYCVVTKGGGRLRFSSEKDIVIGPYFIKPYKRGNGKSKLLLAQMLNYFEREYEVAYAYIRTDNMASIKVVNEIGFELVGNAKITRFFRNIKLCNNQNEKFLVYSYKKNKRG